MDSGTFILNDYIVQKKYIGSGSFSKIYKCTHKVTKNMYAIKEIFIQKNNNTKNIKRELNLMKKLDHPNIVKLYDVIIDSKYNNIYFVIDYFKNGDLSQFLNKQPLKEKYCKKYLKQLSRGLEYLLYNKILHRDLKPQNILLTDEYNIQITDFGLARKFDKNSMFNTLCGSPMYMAPEIINRMDYTYKSDLWSVGIILYEMLHGYTPFKVNNFFELLKHINKKQIEIHVDISYDCKKLLENLLKINFQERIEWSDFFKHNWFKNDTILENDNNLLDISIYSNKSLPNINNYNINENQFCSFIHKSITDNKNVNSIQENKYDMLSNHNHTNLDLLINDNYYNNSLNESITSDEYLSADDNSYSENSNHNNSNCENSNHNNSYSENSNHNNSYSENSNHNNSYSENSNHNNSYSENSNHNNSYSENSNPNNSYSENSNYRNSNGIDIINRNRNRYNYRYNYKSNCVNNSIDKSFEYEYVNSIRTSSYGNTNLNIIKKDFVVINPGYVNSISLPIRNKPLTESLKEYLSSSLKILKSSYNYINNNSI